MALTRDQIFSCSDIKIEKLHIESWGGDIYIRSLTGSERDKFEASNLIRDKKSNSFDVRIENLRARLVALAACDEAGKRIFTDGDVRTLGEKNAGVIALIYDTAARLSGITKEDLEELSKNSSSEPTGDLA